MAKGFNVFTKFTAKDGVTGTMRKIGKGAANIAKKSAKVTAVIGAAIFAVGRSAASYQKSMNRVEAKTQATAAEMKLMGDLAKKLGRETTFSAGQAADAMAFLGMAGMNVNEILATTPHLLSLAASAEMDLARAADITSNIMGAFGKDVSEVEDVVDDLARATAGANVDMEMLALTMEGAAPIAKQYGATLRETLTIAGFLGNIGIQGSNAKTAIKNMFLTLSAPPPAALKWFKQMGVETTKIGKDGKKEMRSFQDSFEDLGTELAKLDTPTRLSAIKDIFGKIPIAAAAALSEDLGKVDSEFKALVVTMNDASVTAAGMAKIMNKGAVGSFARMQSAAEGVSIAMGESGLLDAAVLVFDAFAGLFNFLNEHASFLTILVGILFTVAAAVTAVATAVAWGTKVWLILSKATWIATAATAAFNFIISMNPISLIIIAVAGLITGFVLLADSMGGIGNVFKALGNSIALFFLDPINSVIEAIISLLQVSSLIPGIGDTMGDAAKSLSGFRDKMNMNFTGTTNVLSNGGLSESIITGDGSTPSASNKSVVDVNVGDSTKDDKTVTASSASKNVNLKLSPAT